MIYSDKYKFVLSAIPKTASRSLYAVFVNNYEAVIYKEHHNIIPDEMKDYYSIITVRNPYDRIVSLWYHALFSKSVKPNSGWGKIMVDVGGEKISDLIRYMQRTDIDKLSFPHFFHTQADYLKNNRFDLIMHMEQLDGDIKKIPFVDSFAVIPKINTTTEITTLPISVARNSNPFFYIDQEDLDLINEYYVEDFNMLPEYKKIITI